MNTEYQPAPRIESDNANTIHVGRELPAFAHKNRASVAIERDWLAHGWLGRWVHFLAILFAAGITLICARETYFMDVAVGRITIYLQAFQFLAKVHDIIVTASLADIMIYHLTFNLCQGGGVPLGLIMAPFRLGSPSALLEKSYWSSVYLGVFSRMTLPQQRALGFGALTMLATLITAAIAPLSAILVVPQLSWWHVADPFSTIRSGVPSGEYTGFAYWDMPYDSIWPSSLGAEAAFCGNSFQGIGNCPFYDLDVLTGWVSDYNAFSAPSNIALPERGNMIRYLTATRAVETGFAIASTPMSSVSRNLGTLWLWTKRFPMHISKVGRPVITVNLPDKSKPIMRPLVQTQCGLAAYPNAGASTLSLQFPTNQLKRHPDDKPMPANFAYDVDVAQFGQSPNSSGRALPPDVEFVSLTDATGVSALGAIIAVNFNVSQRAFFACTMSFHWVPSISNIDPKSINVVSVENNPDPASFTSPPYLPPQSKTINVSTAYMQAVDVNRSAANGSLTVFQTLIQSLSLVGGSNLFDSSSDRMLGWPSMMATMLSLQSTAALARIGHIYNMFIWFIDATNSTAGTSTNLADLNSQFFAQPSFDNQKVIGNVTHIRVHPENYTEVAWEVSRAGYAWSLSSGWHLGVNKIKCVALAVVLAHAAFVIIQHIFTAIRHFRGSIGRCITWDSPLSLLLLALQTPERYTTRIRGTSTKVDDSRTYRDIVRIEERPGFVDAYGNLFLSATLTVNDPNADDDDLRETGQNLINQEFDFGLPPQEQVGQKSKVARTTTTESIGSMRLRPGVAYL